MMKDAHACAVLFLNESGTRGRFCLPFSILALGSAIATHLDSNERGEKVICTVCLHSDVSNS